MSRAEDSAHDEMPSNAVDIGLRPRPSDPGWSYSRRQIVTAAIEGRKVTHHERAESFPISGRRSPITAPATTPTATQVAIGVRPGSGYND